MGRFIYMETEHAVQIEDRTLAHLRAVIMNKLRRAEGFFFDVDLETGGGRRSFWMGPSVAVQFQLYSRKPIRMNAAWIEVLARAANSVDGLTIVPEPTAEEQPARA